VLPKVQREGARPGSALGDEPLSPRMHYLSTRPLRPPLEGPQSIRHDGDPLIRRKRLRGKALARSAWGDCPWMRYLSWFMILDPIGLEPAVAD
jgi:hypothetical protein